ncbi:phosphatase PAP2 family protein [Rathayibacter sp. KR2-224]|uniref:phosphatase PAP2 family protein n=1 Tax=Rathayibacter sp. KR2-224 TaxID=3400913 RepID=UPI003BFD126C
MSAHRTKPTPLVSLPPGALLIAIVLWAATFALGFGAKAAQPWLTAQLSVDRALNAAHSPLHDALAKALDRLDSVVVVAVILVVVAVVIGLLSSWLRALAAVVIAGAGWVLCLAPKAIVGELRPPLSAVSHQLNVTHATLSYPSGHTVFAVTLTIAVLTVARGTVTRIVVAVAGILFVAVTAWSRLYVGAHYPTDILGALLAGTAGALLIGWLWNLCVRILAPRLRRRSPAPASQG